MSQYLSAGYRVCIIACGNIILSLDKHSHFPALHAPSSFELEKRGAAPLSAKSEPLQKGSAYLGSKFVIPM